MPLWGTCAGAILMARQIAEGRPEGQPALALMDITARRALRPILRSRRWVRKHSTRYSSVPRSWRCPASA
jgi:hypothetical protein